MFLHAKLSVIIFLFSLCECQSKQNETNISVYNQISISTPASKVSSNYITTNPKVRKIQKGTFSNSSKSDWKHLIQKNFGYKNSTVITNELVSKIGLKKLIKKLGLTKKSNETKKDGGKIIKCLTPDDILQMYNVSSESGLTTEQFMDVCPTLLLQIHYRICREVKKEPVKDYVKIWLYSSGAVIACSLAGLGVVGLIPYLPKSYYNSISQLLIALAVGSLTGDALLHLIPHALTDDGSGSHSHGSKPGSMHQQMVWKSLAAFLGIHVFFLTERIMILCQNLKSKRKLKNKQASHDNVYTEVPSGDIEDTEKVGVKFESLEKPHWASKSRKYSSSSRELEQAMSNNGLNIEPNIGAHLCNRPKNKPHVNSDCPDSMNIDLCQTINPFSMTEESTESQRSASNIDNKVPFNGDIKTSNNNQLIVDSKTPEKYHKGVPTNNSNGEFVHSTTKPNCWSNNEDDKLIGHSHLDTNGNSSEIKIIVTKHLESTVEIGAGGATVKSSLAHPYQNKPHGHHHGHSHDLSSVKAIAYTVIAGDGLHNFCDGIAIGAAFANDIRGGLSTAIAVLCHELPHELGDFVVLLHAGMSFRTALFYNLVSSIFCAAGMVIGVLLGKLPSVSSWIFMITAGMFLYIALVDMMPELSTRRLQGNKLFHRPSILFLWQNVGLILGAVIMLLIALYEEHMF